MATTRSNDIPRTHVAPDTAQAYLHRLVGSALSRRGFDGAEAGALSEIERLLEHHIQRVFEHAHDYAALCARAAPNAADLLAAQSASGWDMPTLKQEARRKRSDIVLVSANEPAEPSLPVTLASMPEGDGDVKPTLARAPEYAWDGAPLLPEPWTYRPDLVPPPPVAPSKVTAGVLDFIKLTATERGDIPPELGLVDYKRPSDGRERRRWGVKGVGAA